jgi:hypothetical protein
MRTPSEWLTTPVESRTMPAVRDRDDSKFFPIGGAALLLLAGKEDNRADR